LLGSIAFEPIRRQNILMEHIAEEAVYLMAVRKGEKKKRNRNCGPNILSRACLSDLTSFYYTPPPKDPTISRTWDGTKPLGTLPQTILCGQGSLGNAQLWYHTALFPLCASVSFLFNLASALLPEWCLEGDIWKIPHPPPIMNPAFILQIPSSGFGLSLFCP
jgi:hypothetical protein